MSDPFQTHGAPSWIELHTADPDPAVKFYSEVLGWQIEGMEMADGNTYRVISVDGARIGGIVQNPAGPARWLEYITVDDVRKRTRLAERRGATVLAAPTAVPGVGTMATLQDPTGATLCLITYERG